MVTAHYSKNHRGQGLMACCACLETFPISRLSQHILKDHHAPGKPPKPKKEKGAGPGRPKGPKGPKGQKIITYDKSCPICLSKFKCVSERDNCIKRHRESMSSLDVAVSCPTCGNDVQKLVSTTT